MPTLRLLSSFSLLLPMSLSAAAILDLAGPWRVELDRENRGQEARWFARELSGTIPLPGSLQTQRLGDVVAVDTKWTGGIFDRSYFTAPEYAPYREPGNIKIPFWLQPETHYVGAAWYQRAIEIPASWVGQHVTLTLERAHWTTTVWLNETAIGSNDANSVAQVYDLGAGVTAGKYTLTIRVDNSLAPDIGENSHSVSDHTQGNWNGMVGRIELRATAPVWADDIQVFADPVTRVARVHGVLRNVTGQRAQGKISVTAETASGAPPLTVVPVSTNFDTAAGAQTFTVDLPLGSTARTWDEFSPAVYRLRVNVGGEGFVQEQAVPFGLRSITTEGRQLLINGRPLFLRGALDCAAFPRTGHPPTDTETWRQILGAIRDHGLNHVRFHSWCPPEAAFQVADELGLYLQAEVASWPNWSTTLGDGKPVDAWTEAETDRIRRAYGNHPSFVLFCAGNEPGGDHHATWLSGWVERQKKVDPRRLYTAGAGWPEVPENDFHLRSEPRIQQWAQGLGSRINARPPETRTDYGDFIRARPVPVVSHEIGQWCVYPNFAEMAKYTGYLKPRNFEIFRDSLAAKGLSARAHDFLIASGKLQALCYKEDIESALRTPTMGGFQLLGLADFPGQGTALVGVLDAFWEEKGYITPAEFRRFSSSTVPLARLGQRVFTVEESLVADLEVAHFGAAPLTKAVATWQLVGDDARVVARGAFPARDIAIGAAQPLGRIDRALAHVPAPARYTLVVALSGETNGGAGEARGVAVDFANDWDVWIYPAAREVAVAPPSGVMVASSFDAGTQVRLAAGDAVVLVIPPARVAPDAQRGPIALGFSSIFWNTAWTNGQAPHTLGILCNPAHPALAAFPTDAHSNWQWWYPLSDAGAMILDHLPRELQPTVQVVDDWFTNRKLGLVFEARVGAGRLLVTSIDLNDAALDPVRRQLRASLLAYAGSPQFQPSVAVTAEQISTLFAR